jgi:hypothetical protein
MVAACSNLIERRYRMNEILVFSPTTSKSQTNPPRTRTRIPKPKPVQYLYPQTTTNPTKYTTTQSESMNKQSISKLRTNNLSIYNSIIYIFNASLYSPFRNRPKINMTRIVNVKFRRYLNLM